MLCPRVYRTRREGAASVVAVDRPTGAKLTGGVAATRRMLILAGRTWGKAKRGAPEDGFGLDPARGVGQRLPLHPVGKALLAQGDEIAVLQQVGPGYPLAVHPSAVTAVEVDQQPAVG